MGSGEFSPATEAPVGPRPELPDEGSWTSQPASAQPTTTGVSPCAQPRADVDSRCAEAERLTAAAEFARDELRETRRRHTEFANRREADAHARDRRRIADEKAAAQADYHGTVSRAVDRAAVETAAAAWLRSMDATNRRAREAHDRAAELDARISELERLLPNMELKADAARISAESAAAACMDARRALAACEERNTGKPAAAAAEAVVADAGTATAPAVAVNQGEPFKLERAERANVAKAARLLMHGNRDLLLGLALRLADETGIEAGRLQLLLLELRESIAARALDDYAVGFPGDHPFWSQFTSEGARNVVASLASLGFRFDGASGWVDGRIPTVRDLAVALSYCGHDPRSMRRPAGQAAVDALWEGTQLRGEDYLLALAPSLALDEVVGLLGPSANRLGELWDVWGRLRPLLLQPP